MKNLEGFQVVDSNGEYPHNLSRKDVLTLLYALEVQKQNPIRWRLIPVYEGEVEPVTTFGFGGKTPVQMETKYCVTYTIKTTDNGVDEFTDTFVNFENLSEAEKTYKEILDHDDLYTANLCMVLKSTD